MRAAIFDLETDGLLDKVTKVHCLVIKDLQTGSVRRLRDHDIVGDDLDALAEQYDILIAHNGIKFDSPVLNKLYGTSFPWHKLRDTMVMARVLWPEIAGKDLERIEKGADFPRNLIGSHSLKAWGLRLGCFKGDYDGGWEQWSQEMEDYCVQDVEVTHKLWDLIQSKKLDPRCELLETQVAHIVARQERRGFYFDVIQAQKLYNTLIAKREELTHKLAQVFGTLYLPDGKPLLPKRDNKSSGYTAGAEVQKVKQTLFNPGSRAHIARWLKVRRGWVAKEFTENGQPKIDEQVIGTLKFPEAPLLAEYLMVEKRIGQLAEGKEAWLKAVADDGAIHGGVNTNGAVTGRMTHSRPNVAQVPSSRKPYGHECRALFKARPGYVLVGADADALELRDLAGYMAHYDKGAYVETVLKGRKEDGTDIHSVNCRALGMDPKQVCWNGASGRDVAKTWFYAFIYGAGDLKLGAILTGKKTAKKAGADSRAKFLANLPALGSLVKAVKLAAKRGYLIGLDGRHLEVRSEHAALNTLLQSAGAVQMKKALCLADDTLQGACLEPGEDYEWVANVHDELQAEARPQHAEFLGRTVVDSIKAAGEFFNFRCPLDGQYAIGDSWASTH
jgi:DNA polymerase I